MKSRASWLIALALLVGLCVGGWAATGRQGAGKGQWEYTAYTYTVTRSAGLIPTSELNRFGAEGWELVSVIDFGVGTPTYYFKRAK